MHASGRNRQLGCWRGSENKPEAIQGRTDPERTKPYRQGIGGKCGGRKGVIANKLRWKIAGAGASISSVEDLRQVLAPTCILETSELEEYKTTILEIIASTTATV